MTLSSNISQHLEMMLNKKSRCEDWVTSVTLRKQCNEQEQGSKSEDEVSELLDEYSDEVCDSSDVSRIRVRKKMIINEKLSLILLCEWNNCDFGTTQNRTDFLQHVSKHVSEVPVMQQPDGSPYYQCVWEKCDFQSVNSSEIKRHINFHAYQTTLKAIASRLDALWELPGCTLTSENNNWLPDLSSPFKCEISTCNYETDFFVAFINHVNFHVDCLDLKADPVISCKWKGCTQFKCRKKTQMKIHMRRHTGEKSLACPACGTMFASNTKYMDHCNRKVPIRDESNQCQYCLRFYPNDRLLRDHMRYHINSQKCSFCEMTFSTPAVLANHVRYKHINARPFHCAQCPFTAVKAEDYNAHMATHESEPKYRCEVDGCSYSCRSVTTLKKHFNSVHLKAAAPIYQCHLCEKEYNRGPSLGTHLRTVHKLERLPGHSRFRYMENKDGYYRLQVERYESLELNNFKGPSLSVDHQMNYTLEEQPADGKESPKKFMIKMNNDQNKNTEGSIIEIDELDEHGNVVYSTTVQEQLINNPDFYFVDVEKCAELTPLREEKNVLDDTIVCEKKAISKTESQSGNSAPRKKRRKVILTDYDCTHDEHVIKNE